MELSLLSKAASFDCLDDIRPKNWVEVDSLGHTEPNLEAVILRGPADSGRIATGKSDLVVMGMQNHAEAGNSLVEHLDLRTGPGHAGLAAVEAHLNLGEATSYDLERSPFEDRDHSLFVERIHRADGPGLEDRWLPQACPYEVSATLCTGRHRDRRGQIGESFFERSAMFATCPNQRLIDFPCLSFASQRAIWMVAL